MKRKISMLLTSLVLTLGLCCSFTSATYTDIGGHWAEKTIDAWQAQELLTNYLDGAFRPNAPITQAEVNQLINAVKGTSGNTGSNTAITRQEAFVLLTTAFGLDTSDTATPAFADGNKVASWAVGSVNALSKAGMLSGYEDGTVRPLGNVTRAEMVTLLDHFVSIPGNLTDLRVEDGAGLVDFDFDPATKTYNITVFEDVYGIRFTPSITGSGYSDVKVTMSGSGIENTTQTVGKNETFELALTQARASSNKTGDAPRGVEDDCDYVVKIEAANGTYTLNIHRPGSDEIASKFTKHLYDMGDGKSMNYWLYLPEDYNANKEYPVVLFLHGSGQRSVDPKDILLRSMGGTAFVKYGKECIIVSPQCNYSDLSDGVSRWTANSDLDLSVFGEAAYDLLLDIEEQYSTDPDRIYITGLSMGGQGSCGILVQHADHFAGALISAATISELGGQRLADAVAAADLPVWFAHAKADGTVPYATNFVHIQNAFDAKGVDYIKSIFAEDTYLAPSAHFSWERMYADEDVLDWLLAQDKGNAGELADLLVEDGAGLVDFDFDKATKTYDVTVFEDVYGIRFTPTINGGSDSAVTVTMSGSGIETTTQTVGKNEPFVLALTQARASSNKTGDAPRGVEDDCDYVVKIEAANGTYTLNIHRPGSDEIAARFTKHLYDMGNGKSMNYWLHVPENYNKNKDYPVVLFLHGSGQRSVDPKDILLRSMGGTAFLKYDKECIIVMPQCNYSDLSDGVSRWTANSDLDLSVFGEAAYDLLLDIEEQYSTDPDRIYITGLSMGGQGSCGILVQHADHFAGALISAATISELGGQRLADAVAAAVLPVWFAHAKADGTVPYATNFVHIQNAFDAKGVDYIKSIFAEDTYLAPSAHFSWERMYADEAVLDWLLAQSK